MSSEAAMTTKLCQVRHYPSQGFAASLGINNSAHHRSTDDDAVAQMIVNRMRVRALLNERRLGELLRGMDPASLGDSWVSVTTGLLACIGDIASLNFMPVFDSTGLHRAASSRLALCSQRHTYPTSIEVVLYSVQSALLPAPAPAPGPRPPAPTPFPQDLRMCRCNEVVLLRSMLSCVAVLISFAIISTNRMRAGLIADGIQDESYAFVLFLRGRESFAVLLIFQASKLERSRHVATSRPSLAGSKW